MPHRPSSRPCVSPCVAAFHLSGSVLLGAQHFVLVTKPPWRQPVSYRGKRLGMGVGVL